MLTPDVPSLRPSLSHLIPLISRLLRCSGPPLRESQLAAGLPVTGMAESFEMEELEVF